MIAVKTLRCDSEARTVRVKDWMPALFRALISFVCINSGIQCSTFINSKRCCYSGTVHYCSSRLRNLNAGGRVCFSMLSEYGQSYVLMRADHMIHSSNLVYSTGVAHWIRGTCETTKQQVPF